MNSKIGSKIDLETHSIEHPIADRSQHTSWFSQLLQAIVTAFKPHNEPIFWKKRDRQGKSWVQGYDPASNRSLEFGSEEEARIWLDLPKTF